MASTLNEITYDLRDHIMQNASDDDNIDIRSIRFWVKNQRNIWLSNEFSKHRPTTYNSIQDLGTLSLSAEGNLMKTTDTIPEPIFVRNRPKIVRVGPVDTEETDYLILPYESAKYHNNGRFNSDLIAAYYYNQRIYLTGNVSALTNVNVRGVFEDPMDVSGMTYDSDYPIDDKFIPYIKAEIIKLDISTFLKIGEDKVNDEEAAV